MTTDPPPPRPNRPRSDRWMNLGCWGLIAFFVVLGVWLFWPALTARRNGHPRNQCMYNLRNIGLALQNYHSQYGCFPPAYIADEQGRPMHSWRVLILRQLDHRDLYEAYRFDEPWDGPNNRKLADVDLPVFRCPDLKEPRGGPTLTNYVVLRGPDTIMGGPRPLSMEEIPDGTDVTLLVVERPGKPVHWMDPRDISAEEFVRQLSRAGQDQLPHPKGVNACWASGLVRFLGQDIKPDVLRSMCHASDGGPQPDEW